VRLLIFSLSFPLKKKTKILLSLAEHRYSYLQLKPVFFYQEWAEKVMKYLTVKLHFSTNSFFIEVFYNKKLYDMNAV
jgi:hypothetical protein